MSRRSPPSGPQLSIRLSNTLWSLVLGFPLPILTAVMLNEIKRFKAFFRFTVYFPSIVPGVAAAILWSLIYHPTSGLLKLSPFDLRH